MIEGDLAETGLAEVLVELAEGGATGSVTLTDPAGAQAAVHLRQGRPYAATLPGADGHGDQPVGAALAELVGWQHGTWRFRLDAPAARGPSAPAGAAVAGEPGGGAPAPDGAVDTAALLRELSALCADDEPEQPLRLPAARPTVAPQRRRGLFSRG